MKVYEIILKPVSGFGTPLKGDTIFGHFCWQLAYDTSLCKISFEEAIKMYPEKPFSVFSSAYPGFCTGAELTYAFRTPALPLDRLFEPLEDKRQWLKKRKEYKALRWMLVRSGNRIDSFRNMEFENDKGLFERFLAGASHETRRRLKHVRSNSLVEELSQSHNTINRLTGTTGEGAFVPFSVDQVIFAPETELVLFAGIDENLMTSKQLETGLARIGESGFGKDASTGLGRFKLGKIKEVNLKAMGSDEPNGCYTLGPCVPQKGLFEEAFFLPFTRFGRHGDALSKSANPFKAPVVMADEAAVLKPTDADIFKKPYIGTAVGRLSKAEPATVAQGYSLYVPVKMEV